ncbi:hypothetical protein HPB48_013264 [Haemaphysalis longicornis]|uniref:Uncharacterized protein n=1 Tax=Haemaphysalis longicornis TaxID=44386 RepID=A0A9J6GIS8_HAELO|nr:hypothetical protein HPB48_013264 [Haemaphysalis longicornis]
MKKGKTCGCRIVQLVTDHHRVKMKMLDQGTLALEVVPPCDSNIPVFLSCDSCDVLKNARL